MKPNTNSSNFFAIIREKYYFCGSEENGSHNRKPSIFFRQKCFTFSVIIVFIMVFILSSASTASENEGRIPPQLLNINRKKSAETVSSVQRNKIIYKHNDKELEGFLLHPKNIGEKKLPAVFFLHNPEDDPNEWMNRMEHLASEGYVVMSVKSYQREHIYAGFENLLRAPMTDQSKVAVMGVQRGLDEAMNLVFNYSKHVNCLVAVSGKPPDEINGKDPADVLNCPILLIHGAFDRMIPSSVSQYFYYSYKDRGKFAEMFLLQNSGHYLNDAEWSQAGIEFLKFLSDYNKKKTQ